MSTYHNTNISGNNGNNNRLTKRNSNIAHSSAVPLVDTSTLGTTGGPGGADDSTNFTAGDESSILLRVRPSHTQNSLRSQTIEKKNSEGSGYMFGNSSVGGSSSFIRPGISYNPTVNTNYNMSNNNANNSLNRSDHSRLTNTPLNKKGIPMTSASSNHPPASQKYLGTFCGLCSEYDLHAETLEYNYALEAAAVAAAVNSSTTTSGKLQQPLGSQQPLPRIRARGEYYIDTFNDEPWSWSMGTNEQNGTWCNSSDQAGTIMSAMVWILMLYSAFTVTALTITEGIPVVCGMLYSILVFMSLSAHAKTSFTDPGSVPVQAIPSERQRLLRDSHSMCGQCQTFKPPGSHHCRICNRCISRMDHHCPWMNNCVGAGNLKHFCLFLIYTWLCAAYSLSIFGWNYFFCADEDCTFHPLVLHLVRLMTLLAIGAFLFTSSMLMNVCYGIMTGIGTIDRLKKKATNTMSQSDEEPIQLIDVFGIGGYWTWPLPFLDPIFEEHDRVMGYTLPSRLDRERQFCDIFTQQMIAGTIPGTPAIKQNPSMDYPGKCVNDLLPV